MILEVEGQAYGVPPPSTEDADRVPPLSSSSNIVTTIGQVIRGRVGRLQ